MGNGRNPCRQLSSAWKLQLPITPVNIQGQKLKMTQFLLILLQRRLPYLKPPWLGLLAKVTCNPDAEADIRQASAATWQ